MSPRTFQLDVLRGLAILLVLGRHLPAPGAAQTTLLAGCMEYWRSFGWIGVDLFFVLSGFLVSGLLFEEFKRTGGIDLGRFLIRRGFKIYPAFYFFIFVTFVTFRLWDQNVDPVQFFSEMLYLQNYLASVWPHTWSLAVEEHFYLMLGLLCFFYVRRVKGGGFSEIVPFTFLVCGLILGLRRSMATAYVYSYFTHHYPTHLRLDSLLFGVLLSYFHHFKPDALERLVKTHGRGLLFLSLILILPPFFLKVEKSFFLYTFGLSGLYLGFGGLLLVMLHDGRWERWRGFLGFRFLARTGFYSYSIYLWHPYVQTWFTGMIERLLSVEMPYMARLSVYLIGSLLIGIGMSCIVEMPFLKLRDRWFPSKGRVAS